MDYDALPDRTTPPPKPASTDSTNPYAPPPPPSPGAPPSTRRRRLLLWVIIPLVTVLAAAGSGVMVGASIKKPEVDSLDDLQPRLVTQVLDRHGETFKTYSRENRILIEENALPELLEHAILAAEDSNFYQHGGIDLKGILRASVKNVLAGRKKEGASTITMQLARTLFLHRERKWKRKIEEAMLSVELEKKLSKQQILTLYANIVNLGHGNYGMEAAARSFFNKSVQDLTISEAAILAGIPQRPATFSIQRNPEAVERRRNYVLGRMLAEGYIDQAQFEAAKAEPIAVVERRHEPQLAPYLAEEVRRDIQKIYGTDALYDRGLEIHTTVDPAIQRAAERALSEGLLELDHAKGWRGAPHHLSAKDLGLEDEAQLDAAQLDATQLDTAQLDAAHLEGHELASWSGDELLDGAWAQGIVLESGAKTARIKIGAEIHTLDAEGISWTRRKRPADVLNAGDVAWFRLAVRQKEKDKPDAVPFLKLEQEPELEGAAIVLESTTGAVRAMVGGWDFERNEFNRATQAHRQVGSAFKPFVFGAALEQGFTAADTLFDGPAVFTGADNEPSYSPRNYYRQYYGVTTLRKALEKSYNVTAVKLLQIVGIDKVLDFAARCGIESQLPPYPSLALGTAELTPIELATAYATIVNGGIRVEPYIIEKVLSQSGRPLQEHVSQARKAMDPQEAFVLTEILHGVTQRGTGAFGAWGLARLPIELGGKTGTTNAFTDAWFAGFSPRYTILTWVGYDRVRFLGRGMTGAHAALPIWTRIVLQGLEDGWLEEGETFARPPGITERQIEANSGLLATALAQETVTEFFVEGSEPAQKFDESWARIVGLPWYLQEPFYLPKEGEPMPSDIGDWTTVREVWQNKDKPRSEREDPS